MMLLPPPSVKPGTRIARFRPPSARGRRCRRPLRFASILSIIQLRMTLLSEMTDPPNEPSKGVARPGCRPREAVRGPELGAGGHLSDRHEARGGRHDRLPRHPLRGRALRPRPRGGRRDAVRGAGFRPAGRPRAHLRPRQGREPLGAVRDRPPARHVRVDHLRGRPAPVLQDRLRSRHQRGRSPSWRSRSWWISRARASWRASPRSTTARRSRPTPCTSPPTSGPRPS